MKGGRFMRCALLVLSISLFLTIPAFIGASYAQSYDVEFLSHLGERELEPIPPDTGPTPDNPVILCGKYLVDSPNEPDGKRRLGMIVARKASDPKDVFFVYAFEYHKFHVIPDTLKRVPTVKFIISGGDIEEIRLRMSPADIAEAVCLKELLDMPYPPTTEELLFNVHAQQKGVPNACGEYFLELAEDVEPHVAVFLVPTRDDPATLRTFVFPKWKIKAVVERGKTVPTIQCFREGRKIVSVVLRMSQEEFDASPCLKNVPPRSSMAR